MSGNLQAPSWMLSKMTFSSLPLLVSELEMLETENGTWLPRRRCLLTRGGIEVQNAVGTRIHRQAELVNLPLTVAWAGTTGIPITYSIFRRMASGGGV